MQDVAAVRPVSCLSDERGSTVVEAAIVVPFVMVVFLFAVQLCLWAHAATVVAYAAAQGSQAASVEGGSPAAGVDRARDVLGSTAEGIVVDPSVDVDLLPGDRVDVVISAGTEAMLPWFHLPIAASSVGTVQEFRPDR